MKHVKVRFRGCIVQRMRGLSFLASRWCCAIISITRIHITILKNHEQKSTSKFLVPTKRWKMLLSSAFEGAVMLVHLFKNLLNYEFDISFMLGRGFNSCLSVASLYHDMAPTHNSSNLQEFTWKHPATSIPTSELVDKNNPYLCFVFYFANLRSLSYGYWLRKATELNI